jgi:hypothetical protein
MLHNICVYLMRAPVILKKWTSRKLLSFHIGCKVSGLQWGIANVLRRLIIVPQSICN